MQRLLSDGRAFDRQGTPALEDLRPSPADRWPPASPRRARPGLHQTLLHLLDGDGDHRWAELDAFEPDEAEALRTLLAIYDLWTAPLSVTAGREAFQHHPAVAALKGRLEAAFVRRLDARAPDDGDGDGDGDGGDRAGTVVDRFRRIGARDLVPPVYEWLATSATWSELVTFVALEGGPDADFDDLVAITQVGLTGGPKLALATNYWDEMGRGDATRVHTELHRRLVEAVDLPRVDRAELGPGALERKALSGLLATNRVRQPEAVGAFGLIEVQAGPRCRAVVRALRRLDAPAGALPFYEEHAHADPRHGKDWIDQVIAPLGDDECWGEGILRGARWRQAVNGRFFAETVDRLGADV